MAGFPSGRGLTLRGLITLRLGDCLPYTRMLFAWLLLRDMALPRVEGLGLSLAAATRETVSSPPTSVG